MRAKPKPDGSILQSNRLYHIATIARRTFSELPDLPGQDRHSAWICLAFSAFTIECWMNELPHRAGKDATAPIPLMLEILGIAESKRLSVSDRYRMATTALTGEKADTGREPYESMKLLFDIRDEIAHKKVEFFVITQEVDGTVTTPLPTRIDDRAAAKGILVTRDASRNFDTLLDRLSNLTACDWAIDTVIQVIQELVAKLPADCDMQKREKENTEFLETYKRRARSV